MATGLGEEYKPVKLRLKIDVSRPARRREVGKYIYITL